MRALFAGLALALAACAPAPLPAPPLAPVVAPAPPVGTVLAGAATPDAELRYQPPSIAPGVPFTFPSRIHLDRPSGLRADLVEQHRFPVVNIIIVVNRRSYDVAEDLFLCTTFMDLAPAGGAPLRAELARLGVFVNGWGCDRDALHLKLQVLPSSLGEMLGAVSGALRRGALTPDQLKREQERIGRRDTKDEPQTRLRRAVAEQLFPADHPYRHITLSPNSAVQKVTVKDLDHARSRIGAADLGLVVVGDISAAAFGEHLDHLAASWPAKSAPAARVAPGGGVPSKATRADDKHGIFVVDEPDGREIELALLFPVPAFDSDDSAALFMLKSELSERMQHPPERDKEKLWSNQETTLERSPFHDRLRIQVRVPKGRLASALPALLAEIEGLGKKPLTDMELRDEKTDLTDWLERRYGDNDKILSRTEILVGLGAGRDTDTRLQQGIAALDAGKVTRAAASFLDPNKALIVALGPVGGEKSALEELKLGKVTVIGPAPEQKGKTR